MKYQLHFETESNETISTSHPTLVDALNAAGEIFGDVVFYGKPDVVLVKKDKVAVAVITEVNNKVKN